MTSFYILIIVSLYLTIKINISQVIDIIETINVKDIIEGVNVIDILFNTSKNKIA